MPSPADSPAGDTEQAQAARTSWLDRLPPRAQLALVVTLLLLATGWGVGMLVLQHRLVEMQQRGRDLGGVGAFFADGSTWATAWPGWAAAFFFALSLLRLLRGSPEPPAGRPRGGEWTAAEMRVALRREYRLVRGALAVVDLLAMLDVGRALAYGIAAATGDGVARGDMLTVGFEAGGLVCAAAVLTVWMLRFRVQLESWGAL
jgi:hypothetical protein